MSTTKTKEELARMAWIVALRQQGKRQCHAIPATRGGKVCAFALLAEMMGEPARNWAGMHRFVGLSAEQAIDVVCMNDGGINFSTDQEFYQHTFSEIADVVEGWFTPRGVETGSDIKP